MWKQLLTLLKNWPCGCRSRSTKQAGVGAMVVSEISERAVLSLEAPIGRVSAPDTIFPFGQAENIWLPNAKDIEAKAREIVEF